MSDPRPRLLIVDDDPDIAAVIRRLADRLDYTVEYRADGPAALAALGTVKPHVALVDLQMPGMSGLEVLRAIRAADPDCAVVLMTGHATIDSAVEAVKSGALDYLGKPFEASRLQALLSSVRDELAQRSRLFEAEAEVAHRAEYQGIVGRGPAMQQVFALIRRLAPHVRSVLISGETGTGKELVARALHRAGPRHAASLVSVNCSAVVETLFESELFGHVKGAFTGATESKVGRFEHANRGTLFLDEAGELPLAVQPKLLRAVEQGEIQRVGSLETHQADVCVIAATNRDLHGEVAAGRFRADLFYRLSVVEIHLPPLRERRDDIPYLAATFIEECAARLKKPIRGLTAAADAKLQDSMWPGNIRELRNVIERACILSDGPLLGERDVAPSMRAAGGSVPGSAPDTAPLPDRVDPALLSTAQRDQIQRVLRDAKGNKSVAAKRLGVSRRSLYRWLDRLDISE